MSPSADHLWSRAWYSGLQRSCGQLALTIPVVVERSVPWSRARLVSRRSSSPISDGSNCPVRRLRPSRRSLNTWYLVVPSGQALRRALASVPPTIESIIVEMRCSSASLPGRCNRTMSSSDSSANRARNRSSQSLNSSWLEVLRYPVHLLLGGEGGGETGGIGSGRPCTVGSNG